MSEPPSLSDDPRVVYPIYAIAFIPLTVIYALDFVKENWRSIRDTRRNGMIQLFVSLPSLACLLYYINIQVTSGDHKEAAAAITVAGFNSFHVLRTIWGLIQLYEFKNWNVFALRCLLQLGYSAPVYDYSDEVKRRFSGLFGWHPRTPLPPSSSSSFNLSALIQSGSLMNKEYCRPVRLFQSFKSKCKSFHYWVSGDMEATEYKLGDLPYLTLDDIKRTVDHHMVVNSSLFDNEFTSNEIPIEPTVLSRIACKEPERHNSVSRFIATYLKSRRPERCSIRWLVSFLAKFGYSWLAHTRSLATRASDSPLAIGKTKDKASQDLAVLASLHTTHGSVDATGSTERFLSPFAPAQSYCISPEKCRTSLIEITDRCMLPFKMKGYHVPHALKKLPAVPSPSAKLFDFSRHEATIRNAANDDWHRASLNKLDNAERTAVENITAVQLACFATLMEEELKDTDDDGWDPFGIVRDGYKTVDWEREDPRVENLMFQLGYDHDKDYIEFFQELPIRKEFLGSLLWTHDPNRLLFQTSVHVDNFLALESGDSLHFYLKEHQASVHRSDQNSKTSVFEDQYDLETNRLRSKIVQTIEPSFPINFDTPRFIGSVVETVRHTLAEWVANNPEEPDGWTPSIAPVGIRFLCSKQLCSAFGVFKNRAQAESPGELRSLQMRLIWEVQSYLQWKLWKESVREDQDIRESPLLIMLFILGFPDLKVEERRQNEPVITSRGEECAIELEKKITVMPIGGPQELIVLLRIDEDSKAISVELYPEDQCFCWQAWKDTVMGRMYAQKQWRLTRLLSKREFMRKEASSSNISSPIQVVSRDKLGTDYDLTFWSGWPPFLPQIAQFEVRKLREVVHINSRHEQYDRATPEQYIQYIADLNAAMDIHFLSRMTPTSLYNKGHRALNSGRDEEALKMFGRCIAEHGHRGALKDAVNLLLKKDPVSKAQELALRMQMDIWFKALVNRSHDENANTPSGEIDLEMLARYFGRLYEATGASEALLQKSLALFHTTGIDEPVSLQAIQSIESFLICDPDEHYCFNFYFFLAIAHQSLFEASGDTLQQEIASKYISEIGTHDRTIGKQFGMSIGFLLESGYYVGRNSKRGAPLLSFFCGNEEWDGGERLRAMFERLFVQTKRQEDNVMTTFGMGKSPRDAIAVYKHMIAGGKKSDGTYSAQAFNRLGLLYHRGAEGLLAIKSEAKDAYLKAIELGSKDALCNMGVLKYGDIGEGTDTSYLKKSCEEMSSSGMNNLAVAYELGKGVNRDIREAEQLYKEAIRLDRNPVAMYNLAVLYMCGDPQLRTAEAKLELMRLIDELSSPNIELVPLYILKDQVGKLASLRTEQDANWMWEVGIEEIDDCLAYVKILEYDNAGDTTAPEKVKT